MIPKAKRWTVASIVTIAVLFAAEAKAQIPEKPTVGLQFGGAAAVFLGDLNQRTELPVLDFQIKTLFYKNGAFMSYLAIDVLTLSTINQSERFLFASDANLRVLAFLFIPHVCYLAASQHVSICGGIGQGTVNVNSDSNRRDYGTWNYQVQVDYYVADGWSVGLQAKYVGRVEQEIDGVDSFFTFVTAGLSVGWMY